MDIEAVVIKHLSGKLPYLVASDVPNPRPDYLVTVERTGGAVKPGIEYPTMAVQCWAPTRAEASTLSQTVESALETLDETNEISQVSINSVYNWPTEKNEQRYQIIINLVSYR